MRGNLIELTYAVKMQQTDKITDTILDYMYRSTDNILDDKCRFAYI